MRRQKTRPMTTAAGPKAPGPFAELAKREIVGDSGAHDHADNEHGRVAVSLSGEDQLSSGESPGKGEKEGFLSSFSKRQQ